MPCTAAPTLRAVILGMVYRHDSHSPFLKQCNRCHPSPPCPGPYANSRYIIPQKWRTANCRCPVRRNAGLGSDMRQHVVVPSR
eukprot:scaffold34632_cov43-Tisochrysis_lutea.AAC.1